MCWKKHCVYIVLATTFLLSMGALLVACDDEKSPVWHYKVYRENFDGTYTLWTMNEKPDRNEGFLCWTKKDGSEFCISGKITIEPYQVGVK